MLVPPCGCFRRLLIDRSGEHRLGRAASPYKKTLHASDRFCKLFFSGETGADPLIAKSSSAGDPNSLEPASSLDQIKIKVACDLVINI